MQLIVSEFESINYVDNTTSPPVRKSAAFELKEYFKYRIIRALIGDDDVYADWNQAYGVNLTDGKVRTIGYDFDRSFACTVPSPDDQQLFTLAMFKFKPPESRARYLAALNLAVPELFGDEKVLDQLLLAVDKYPFPAERRRFKGYLKLRFYNFALFFDSPAIEKAFEIPRIPLSTRSRFLAEARRIRDLEFNSYCTAHEKRALSERIANR